MEKIIIPSLKHLICSHNLFTSIYLEVLEPVLSNYKALEELDFVGNEIILNKAFVPKLSHLVSLKILNGVPVFRGTGTLKSQKKVFEKKKTDIKTESTEIIDYIEYNALKGVSLQDIFKSKEELPPTQ